MTMTRVVVSSRLEGGHRRGGKLWPQTQTEVDVDEKVLAQIKADEHLVVVEVPQPPAKTTKSEKQG
jgi:hypothetical protein